MWPWSNKVRLADIAADTREEKEERHRKIERRLTWAILLVIIGEIAWNHWQEFFPFPELSLQFDYTAPYSLPFTAKNPSPLLRLRDVRWTCRAQWEDGVGAQHTLDGIGGSVSGIGPRETKRLLCQIIAPAQAKKFLTAVLTMQYRTALFGERRPAVLALQWGNGSWVASDTP
jgi:hypothetical protein